VRTLKRFFESSKRHYLSPRALQGCPKPIIYNVFLTF